MNPSPEVALGSLLAVCLADYRHDEERVEAVVDMARDLAVEWAPWLHPDYKRHSAQPLLVIRETDGQ